MAQSRTTANPSERPVYNVQPAFDDNESSVMACFIPQWPDLILGVAYFGVQAAVIKALSKIADLLEHNRTL